MIELITEKNHKYLETKTEGSNLLLLHGLFGALSNFNSIVDYFKKDYNVIIPMLPIYDLPMLKTSITGLVGYLESFIDFKGYDKFHVLGNSLGGHIGLIYTLKNPTKVSSISLTGSSGLFENSMGGSFPQRGNYEYVKERTESTFYDPKVATKELVDEVYEILNNRIKALKVIATAKSALRQNLSSSLHEIKVPTLLVWGKQDIITPPFVGEKFKELIPHARLELLDKCGHAPMMELPIVFNQILSDFLSKS